MAVAQNDVLKVTAKWSIYAVGDNQNVFHVRCDQVGGVSDADCLDDLAEWMEDVYAPVLNNMCITITTDTISVLNTTTNGDVGTVPWPTYTGGLATADQLPSGVAALVIASTALIKHVGRKFIPGFTVVSQVLGEWTSATLTAMASFGVAWITPFTSSLGNDYSPGIVRKDFGTFMPFLGGVARSVCAYQRRRRKGTGI